MLEADAEKARQKEEEVSACRHPRAHAQFACWSPHPPIHPRQVAGVALPAHDMLAQERIARERAAEALQLAEQMKAQGAGLSGLGKLLTFRKQVRAEVAPCIILLDNVRQERTSTCGVPP